MKELSLKMINASSPYDVMMVDSNTYRFVTDYGVEIAISFDLDDLLEHCEAYMFNITNVNKHRSPRDMKVRDTVLISKKKELRKINCRHFVFLYVFSLMGASRPLAPRCFQV